MAGTILIRDEDVRRAIEEADHGYSRYNGGWYKRIDGLDRTKTNGYSLLGEFVRLPTYFFPGDLLLDCSIGGSRKHHEKWYNLLRVNEDGTLTHLKTVHHSKEWAINLWEVIEENLLEEPGEGGEEGEEGEEETVTVEAAIRAFTEVIEEEFPGAPGEQDKLLEKFREYLLREE